MDALAEDGVRYENRTGGLLEVGREGVDPPSPGQGVVKGARGVSRVRGPSGPGGRRFESRPGCHPTRDSRTQSIEASTPGPPPQPNLTYGGTAMVWSVVPLTRQHQSVFAPMGFVAFQAGFVFSDTPSVSKPRESGGKSRGKFVKTDGVQTKTVGSHGGGALVGAG